MKKYIVIFSLLLAFGFSRTSVRHQIVVSPEYSFNNKSSYGTIAAKDLSGENSLKWKRRHKRRKKTRRPQRGR